MIAESLILAVTLHDISCAEIELKKGDTGGRKRLHIFQRLHFAALMSAQGH